MKPFSPLRVGSGAALVIVLCAAALSFAQTVIVIGPDHRIMPGPLPPSDVPAVLQVVQHQVRVSIRDQVATTTVEQVFRNPGNRRLEADYLFPVPRDAQIDKFSMDVAGKQQEAELLDADKARAIYEDIVRRSRDPGLLEYAGQRLLRLRAFPIEPNSDKKIVLKYTQLLKNDSGTIGYTYPLGTGKFTPGNIPNVSLRVEIESARPIANIYSPSHAVEVKRHGATNVTVGFEAADTRPDADFQLFFTPVADSKDGVTLSLLTFRDQGGSAGDAGYFLLLASPGAVRNPRNVVPKDVVFVADTSGSMAGAKLDQLKRALRFCIANLNEGDRFEIIRFSTEAEPLFGSVQPADKEHRATANQFVDQFKPIGGTAIDDAMKSAVAVIQKRPLTEFLPAVVIFLTDGRPTIGTLDEDAIVAGLSASMGRVFCFGIGNDVNTHLLDKITEKMRGVSQYVLPEEDIEVKVSNFYSKINSPVLTNLKLSFDGLVKVSKLYPIDLPDLFEGEQLVLGGRYSGSGDVAIHLTGSAGEREKTVVYEANFADRTTEHGFVPRLWATRRVGYLLDEIRLHGENTELRDEVTQLARQFGIVTPYTAYLIVEDESRRNVPVLSRTMQVPPTAERPGAHAYREMTMAKSGAGSVGAAQANDALKSALQPAAAPVAAQTIAVRAGEADLRQQVKLIRGRAFFQNGQEWIDANVQRAVQARRVDVQFNTQPYFDLMKAHPDAAAWLSAGQKVQVLLGDTVYVVR